MKLILKYGKPKGLWDYKFMKMVANQLTPLEW